MKRDFGREARVAGWVLLGLSGLLFIALEVSTRWEQSQTPGEKNMGVAALAIMFGVPMLVCAAAGALVLLIGNVASAYRHFFPRGNATDQSQ